LPGHLALHDLAPWRRFPFSYAAHGLPTVPLKEKKPAVKHPQRFGLPGSSELSRKPNFADCSGIGFIAGARSKISVLDVDTTDERVLADALNRHGQMPLVRTASGKWHAYYRHNGERRWIRPWPDRPIDLIGGGLAVAPPTSTARGSYEIDDLNRLPVICVEQVGRPPVGTGESISDGECNEKLFR
jgi:hypothetical protein